MKKLSKSWIHFSENFSRVSVVPTGALFKFALGLCLAITLNAFEVRAGENPETFTSEQSRKLLAQYQILQEGKFFEHKPEEQLRRLLILEDAPYVETIEYLAKFIGVQCNEIIEQKSNGKIDGDSVHALNKGMDILIRLLNKNYLKHKTILGPLENLKNVLSVEEWKPLQGSSEALKLAFERNMEVHPRIAVTLFSGLSATPPIIDERSLGLLLRDKPYPLPKDVAMQLVFYFAHFKVAEVSAFYHRLISTSFFDSDGHTVAQDIEIFGRVMDVISKDPAFLEQKDLKLVLTNLQKQWWKAYHDRKNLGPEHADEAEGFRREATLLDSLLKPRSAEALAALKLPSLADLLASGSALSSKDSLKSQIEKLKKFKERMGKIVIGQAEAIEALFDIEFSKKLFPNRKVPEVLYLMGTPGTGKDTLAEAYVDQLLGYKGAHQTHLFRIPVAKDKTDISSILGSATGFVGSQDIPPLIRYLVEHSGGRYLIQEKTDHGSEAYIYQNPDWKGKNLPGYEPASNAVVFVNEFHNWSSEAKDEVLKQFLEKGLITIRRPGSSGLSQIFVPATVILASNEGMNLLTQTDRTGRTRGAKLTSDELQTNYFSVFMDKGRLKDAIQETNAGQSKSLAPKGISPEMLSRIPNSRIVLMKPFLPSELTQIAEIKLREMVDRFQDGPLKGIQFSFSKELLKYIQEFNYSAEEGARNINNNISSLIERTLKDAILAGKLTAGSSLIQLDVKVIKRNGQQLAELVFTEPNALNQKGSQDSRQFIAESANQKYSRTLSKNEVEKMKSLAARLKQHVVGQDLVLEKMANQLIIAKADGADVKVEKPAVKFFALGWSSTGKTETAKAIARELFDSESALKVFDFSQVRAVQDIKEKILGTIDHNGEPVKSEFMLEYDKRQGRIVVVLDEIANAPESVLNAIYDILREANVSTFSDGISRPMTNVIIVMTGNAGENAFKRIPQDIPLEEQMAAFEEVHRKTVEDPSLQRTILENHFSNAFINRVGEQNFFFYSPLGVEALRKLSHLKMQRALKEIANSAYAWKVQFKSLQAYLGFLDTIEQESMIVREQGSSIDRGVYNFINALRLKLILQNTAPNSIVTIDQPQLVSAIEGQRRSYNFNVEVQKGKTKQQTVVNVDGKIHSVEMKQNQESQVLTAYHEAGHEVVRQVLFNGEFASVLITTRPGVAHIGGEWIRYLGVAVSNQIESSRLNYANVIRLMAVNAAGYVAEGLISSDSQHDAGKRNDMERATNMAHKAILEWGLSGAWGKVSRPSTLSLTDYIASLSQEKRALLTQETDRMIQQAELLARAALLNNMKTFRDMGYKLAETGTLNRSEISRFYERNSLIRSDKFNWSLVEKNVAAQTPANTKSSIDSKGPKRLAQASGRSDLAMLQEMFATASNHIQWQYSNSVPANVADNGEILRREREARLAKVDLKIPDTLIRPNAAAAVRCEVIFR